MAATADRTLWERWRDRRDAFAFEELVRRHSAMVFGVCLRTLRNRADAEDVTQECFMALSAVPAQPVRSVPCWLHSVATSRSLDRVRATIARESRERRFAESQHSAVEPKWDDLQDIVDEAIAELPQDLREPTVLHFLEGRSHSDIAKHLRVSRRTVRRRLGSAIERIRDGLRKRGLAVSSVVLTALLTAHASEAAISAILVSALGRIALAGGASAEATGVAVAGNVFNFTKAIMATVSLLAVGTGAWVAYQFVVGRDFDNTGEVQPTDGNATKNQSSGLPAPIDASTLDALIPTLRRNESVVRSYSGRMRQTIYTLVSTDKDGVRVYKGTEDPFVDVFESEFVYDRSRGHDYHVHIHHVSSPNPVSRPYIEERRHGTEVETLVMDPEKRPVLGLIKRLNQAANLGHAPRNMDTRSEIFVGSSSEEQGYLRRPLSELLDNNEHVWLYPGEFEVAGQPCMKIALQFEGPVRGRVAFVWLNKNANLCIQKQLTVNPHGDFIRDLTGNLRLLGWSSQDYLTYLETLPPATLVVNEEYTKLAPDFWIPQKSTAYALSYLIPKEAMQQELQSSEDYERIRRLKDNFPATAQLENIIVRGYHVFELNMNSLRVNEPVDASVFEESIIPDGVPVSDFVRNVHAKEGPGTSQAENNSTDTLPPLTDNNRQWEIQGL